MLSLCFFVLTPNIYAQKIQDKKYPSGSLLSDRIQISPESVFSKFRSAGMKPVNHVLTNPEKEKVEKAFSVLPPLYQDILKEHLHSISFMDNMPNTALTSPVETTDSKEKFNITFRAEILYETISEWATWKENTGYLKTNDSEDYHISVEAGEMDAIIYVLLHEATHVVDAVLKITPHPENNEALIQPTQFTRNIWDAINMPVQEFIIPLLETTRFRSGKPISISQAAEVYKALLHTPFVSLYGMASWHEDLAEIATIYHLVEKLHQTFRISVKKNDKEIYRYEPLKNELVIKRLPQMANFYE